jgi:hypothetical protein
MLKPVAVAKDEGEARWWFASLAVIKATAVDTGGQMTIIEITEPPGSQAPLHVHHREDEIFWILEGDLTAAQSSSFESGAADVTRYASCSKASVERSPSAYWMLAP